MGSLYLQILGVPSVPRFPRAGPGPGRISAAFQDGTDLALELCLRGLQQAPAK